MAQSHLISAIFAILLSANIIQGAVIQGIVPATLFHEQTIPSFVNTVGIPHIGQVSDNFANSAASAASSAVSGFKTYVDNFRNGLSQHIQVPATYPVLHQFLHGDIWPNVAARPVVGVAPSRVYAPGLFRNYGGRVGDGSAASAASSAASA
ncbi:hypothetical protein PUN28_013663 [Cardiocondyla obscurior]|uniref:Uncharacterized protein n=1 Tax=Cardiocondyla obscurior TaxID=286306 RepID=A0AAW2F4N5_9HYME